MARGEDSVLGELATNLEGLNVRGRGDGTSVNGKAKGKASSASSVFDNDVLPTSGRFARIDVTADVHEAGERSSNGSASSSRHPSARRLASSGSTSGGRGDRFIPNRDHSRSGGMRADHALGGEKLGSLAAGNGAGNRGIERQRSSSPLELDHSQNLTGSSRGLDLDNTSEYNGPATLDEALQIERGHQILSFNAMAPDNHSAPEVRTRYAAPRPKLLPSSLTAGGRRRIATTPEKTLDTPDMRDDFYSHLLCWSSQNVIAIALGASVHTWNGTTGDVAEVCDLMAMSERVGGGATAVVKTMTWDDSGTLLQLGTSTGHVQIWDMETGQRVRTFKPTPDGANPADNTSLTTSSWAEDGTLAVGYWSGLLREHDLRQRNSVIRDIYSAHSQSICGMAYRADSALLATGGNDNVVKVWDRRTDTAKMQKERHRAAVRALSWSPMNSSLLASGGGTLDKTIHFWNVTQGTRLQSIKTDAQVTALHWSTRYKEIASCHGTSSTSAEGSATPSYLNLWSYPSLDKLESLQAHESRTLHSCLSPDGQVLATCGTDESLKFWRLFEIMDDAKSKASTGSGGMAGTSAGPPSSASMTGASSATSRLLSSGANPHRRMHSLR